MRATAQRFGTSKKIVALLAAKRSNGKSEGTATLGETENRLGFFVSPIMSPGCIKMGGLLMTWDNEGSSASHEEKVVCVVETTADEV